MPNKVFKLVVKELDFVGDILSKGITKKAVLKEGTDPDNVTTGEMKRAIKNHIEEALLDFVSKKRIKEWRKNTVRKLNKLEGK